MVTKSEIRRLYGEELQKQLARHENNIKLIRNRLGGGNRQAAWCRLTGMRRNVADAWEAILTMYQSSYYADDVVRASHGELSQWTGLSVNTVRRAIDVLCKYGLLHRMQSQSKFDVTPVRIDLPTVVNVVNRKTTVKVPNRAGKNPTRTKEKLVYLLGIIYTQHQEITRLRAKCGEESTVDLNNESEPDKASVAELNKAAAELSKRAATLNNISSISSSVGSRKEEPSLALPSATLDSSSVFKKSKNQEEPKIQLSSAEQNTLTGGERGKSVPTVDKDVHTKERKSEDRDQNRGEKEMERIVSPSPNSAAPSPLQLLIETRSILDTRLIKRLDVLRDELSRFYPEPPPPELIKIGPDCTVPQQNYIKGKNDSLQGAWEEACRLRGPRAVHIVKVAACQALYQKIIDHVAAGNGVVGLARAIIRKYQEWQHNQVAQWKLDTVDVASFAEQIAADVIGDKVHLADLLVSMLAMRTHRANHCGYAMQVLSHDFGHRKNVGPIDVLLRETLARDNLGLQMQLHYSVIGQIDSVREVNVIAGKKLPKLHNTRIVSLAKIADGLPWLTHFVLGVKLPLSQLIDLAIASVPRHLTDEHLSPYITDILREELPA